MELMQLNGPTLPGFHTIVAARDEAVRESEFDAERASIFSPYSGAFWMEQSSYDSPGLAALLISIGGALLLIAVLTLLAML